ncbi:MAG: hypothetical protein WAN51_09460 [Alphaproteobacteria bacterium]
MTATKLKSASLDQRPANPDQAVHIVVSRAGPRRWSVCSSDNNIGGMFLQHDRALVFARQEAMFLPDAVVVDKGGRALRY